jgi:hypothetical protein
MTKIGRIALCNSCHEEKTIAAEFSSETSGREIVGNVIGKRIVVSVIFADIGYL